MSHKKRQTPSSEFDFKDASRIGELHSVSGEKPRGKVFLITFDCFGKRVGELEFHGKKLHFKGDAAKSAKLLFDRLKEFVELYVLQRLELGPRSHKVSIPASQLKVAQFNRDPDFTVTLDQLSNSTGHFFFNWFKQARKPGDKFIVEITNQGGSNEHKDSR